MEGALSGMAVLVTRPEAQAESLCRRLQALGANVYRLPTLAIEPLPLDDALRGELGWAATADWLVFVSPNAVEIGLDALRRAGLSPADGCRIAVVGPGSAQALERRGLSVHLCPEQGFDSEALLAADWDVAGRRVAIIRGVGGRELLGETLGGRGATVRFVEVYRRVLPPSASAAATMTNWLTAGVPVAVVTSQNGLINLLKLAPAHCRDALRQARLVCVSQRIADTAAELGFNGGTVIAPAPGDEGIAQALLAIAANNENRKDHDGTNR